MSNRESLFAQLDECREATYRLCSRSNCQHLPMCRKNCSVCLKDTTTNKRHLVSTSGGQFARFITIRNRLVETNMGLVIKQVRTSGCNPGTMPDLIQEGAIGLIKAVERFRLPLGNKFSTYAYGNIRKMILKYMKSNNIVRRRGKTKDLISTIHRVFDRLVQSRRFIDTALVLKEIAKDRSARGLMTIKISESCIRDEVDNLILQTKFPYSDRYIKSYSMETVQEHSHGLYDLLIHKLDDELIRVPITTAEIVKLRFGLGEYTRPLSTLEIGAVVGMTRQGVEKRISKFFERRKT